MVAKGSVWSWKWRRKRATFGKVIYTKSVPLISRLDIQSAAGEMKETTWTTTDEDDDAAAATIS